MKKGNERGAVLVVGLLIVLVLTILSMAAMMSTGTELKIAANDLSAKEAFYLAEAGLEEARARLGRTDSTSINDGSNSASVDWVAFIGEEQKLNEKNKGFQSGNGVHARYNSLYPNLNYLVTIAHKNNSIPLRLPPPNLIGSPPPNVLYWGDSNNDGKPEENTATGSNIYVITSEGYTLSGATKTVRTEVARKPPITAPAALYTKAQTTIHGSSTKVIGDAVGGCGPPKPGITTTATVNQTGTPTITGTPPIVLDPLINIDVQYMVNQFKGEANYSYNVASDNRSGMNWGTPTGATGNPSSCGVKNIVHFNTNNTFVQLTGQSSGCGILLVEGDLEVNGGFSWYGVILVTGSITFSGGGGKNVTGAILSGGAVSADVIGGGADIIYCSSAIDDQTNNYPLVTLRWVELFG